MFTYTVLQASAVLPVSEILNLVCGCYFESLDKRSAHFRFLSTKDNTNTHTHTNTNYRVSRVIRSHSRDVRTIEDTTRIRQHYVLWVAAAGFGPQEASLQSEKLLLALLYLSLHPSICLRAIIRLPPDEVSWNVTGFKVESFFMPTFRIKFRKGDRVSNFYLQKSILAVNI